MNTSIVVVGALLALAALPVVWPLIRLRASLGRRIAEYGEPRAAVVIVDVQEDYTGPGARPPFPYRGSAAVVQVLNDLAGAAAARRVPVVYVRHEFAGFQQHASSPD